MTDRPQRKYEKTGLGLRVAKYRKIAGFRDAQALADAVPSEAVTRSTIVNIELGRKSDPSIGELLAIAEALNRSPLELLLDLEDPFAVAELPTMARTLTNLEVERWFRLQFELKSLPDSENRARRVLGLLNDITEASSWIHAAHSAAALQPLTGEARQAIASYRRIIEGDARELRDSYGVDVPDVWLARHLDGQSLTTQI
ncbi:hypothetical protein C5C74_08320 [Rathayibacter sp. AY1E8]|uniref:helix-turn-helix transcriptional regulator n=1 Tax=Rathayibacter sp. AY1E8 TaxID=2080555 RepID=UPI000CE8847F|nr:helix-turn-helix transcriptional regulator [Rathayibacter sp. AY1E8]PPG18971.1 hypothetical protein C5C74_08320 [Rathayibacter sp. AY1E8]